jgi:hypothetical protein
MKKINYLLLTVIMLMALLPSFGQGFRYGSVQYQIQSADATTFTVKFRFEEIWDASSPKFNLKSVGDMVNISDVNFGDGDIADLELEFTEIRPDGTYKGFAEVEHTYAIGGSYAVDVLSLPRTNTQVVNNALYRLRSNVIYPFNGYESPAINVGVPLTIATDGNPQNGIIDIGAGTLADSRVTGLTYSLPDQNSTGLLNAPWPNFQSYSIDPNTGVISYTLAPNTPTGDYATQVKVTDNLGGEAVTDFLITVVNQCTPVPTFVAPTPPNGFEFVTTPGNPVSFSITAQANDPNNVILTTISAVGIPTGATYVASATPASPTTATFSWTPTLNDIGLNSLVFTAKNTSNCGLAANRQIKIRVQKTIPQVDLTLLDACSDDPIKHEWEITNNQTFTVPYLYELLSDPLQTGFGLAPPGTSFLSSVPTGGVDELRISWIDLRGQVTDQEVWNAGLCTPPLCNQTDDIVAVVDVSSGQACGSTLLTYYDGVSGPIELSAMATAGLVAPYTYLWNTGEATQNIFVTPTANSSYSVVITDANGCTATANASVVYCDARAYKKNGTLDPKKVKICHYPPGNPGNVQTITISINALCTHISQHGDAIGDCNCGTSSKKGNAVDFEELTSLNVFPNPTQGNFNIEYNLPEDGDVRIVLSDLTGRTVYTEDFNAAAGLYEHGINIEDQASGLYILKVTLNADEYTMKVNLSK